MNNFKAFILDFDGVIVDSIEHNWVSTFKIMQKFNVQISKEEYDEYIFSKSSKKYCQEFLKMKLGYLPADFHEIFVNEKAKSDNEFAQNAKIYDDTKRFLQKYLYTTMGICSATRRAKLQKFLVAQELTDRFKFAFTSEDVVKSKPAPDIYLLGVDFYKKQYGFNKGEILAIEDSCSGVKAAKAAGIFCIAVTHTTNEDTLLACGADFVVQSMDEI